MIGHTMEYVLVVGVLVAVFVGYNIGGATTGVSFGPAVGARVLTSVGAAVLMSICFFVGGWIVGPAVVETLGEGIVEEGVLTLNTGIIVMFFIGASLYFGNYFGVPASTSMTAVGSIAGLGLATGTLQWDMMGRIVSWWIVAPVLAFWICGVVGRYWYPTINRMIAIPARDTNLFQLDTTGTVPRLTMASGTDRRELGGSLMVIAIGCYMAFSSGASNVANAVAPLVGSGAVTMNAGVLIACIAVAIGAFTIARRTIATMANDVTALPLTAAIVVMGVSATIVTGLSAIGIPVQLVIVATMAIIGLGWGRATRTSKVSEAVTGAAETQVTTGALGADEVGEALPRIGEEKPKDLPRTADLFDPSTTARVILIQNLVPVIATIGAFLTFALFPGLVL